MRKKGKEVREKADKKITSQRDEEKKKEQKQGGKRHC